MKDLPILSSRDLLKTLKSLGHNIKLEDLNAMIMTFSAIKGFGPMIRDNIEKDEVYFLTQAQALMLTCKFSDDIRWSLVKSLMSLTDNADIVETISREAVDKRTHMYHENKSLLDAFRPLCNILVPAFDNEFFAATHYQFTQVFNRVRQCNLSVWELKELMRNQNLLKSNHRTITGGRIKEIVNYITFADGTYVARHSPVYTEEDVAYLIATLRTHKEDT